MSTLRLFLASLLILTGTSLGQQLNPQQIQGKALVQTPAAAQTIAQPVGTALNHVGSTTFTNASGLPITSFTFPGLFTTTTNTPNLYLEGGYSRSDLLNTPGFSHDDTITIGQTTPSSATSVQTNGIAVFQNSQSSSNNTVNFYGQVNAGTNNNTIWGINTNLQDTDVASRGGTHHTNVTEFNEFDCNASSTMTAGACILIAGIMTAQPAQLGAFHLLKPPAGSTGRWSYGFLLDDGAVNGLSVSFGSFHTTGNSSSQVVGWRWRNGSNVVSTLSTFADAQGRFRVQDAAGAETDFFLTNGVLLTGNNPSVITSQSGVPNGSIVIPNNTNLYSPVNNNTRPRQLIGLGPTNRVVIDQNGQGASFGSTVNAVGGFQTNGTVGLTHTITLPCGTAVYTGGLLTAVTGTC